MRLFKNRRKTIGWILTLLGLILGLGTWRLLVHNLQPSSIEKNVQKTVIKLDKELQTLIDNGVILNEIEKEKTGVFVYTGDSLTYWNNNEIHPKLLKRRILVGRDTICNCPSGDYYIKSIIKDNKSYYLFKMINSHYKIENQYFVNSYKLFPFFIESSIRFHQNEGDFNIYNNNGKLLTRGSLSGTAKLKKPFNYIWHLPFSILSIIGLYLALVGQKKRESENKTKKEILKIGIILILVLSITGTFVHYKRENLSENEQMKVQAEKLLEKREFSFEKSFAVFAEQIKTDTNIRNMLFDESNVLADVILGYSKELLFDKKMKEYTTTLTICKPNEEITIEPEGYISVCEEYFKDKLINNAYNQVNKNLYFIDYYTLDPNYLGIIDIYSTDSLKSKTLYFEYYKPIAPEGFGFPQLIQEKDNENTNNYSVANYKNQLLVYKYGKFIYPNYLEGIKVKDRETTIDKGYKHYSIQDEKGNSIIISKRQKGWSEITAPFSMIFLSLLIPLLIIYWILKPQKSKEGKNRNLQQKLQNLVLSTLALTFAAIGPISIIYIQSIYNQKTQATQFETTRTLAIEMTINHNIKALLQYPSKENWNNILQQYASSFFTDLNLYNLEGTLLATTRQEIYDLNLQAPIMNSEAYENIHKQKELYYTHKEHLGKGTFESAYIPLNDENGNALAYLNTPYFSSTEDLHKEITNFILTYINIILLLLAIALLFVFNITKKLTQPLMLIQEKIKETKIDKKNEPIKWNSDDEIGRLIKEYNKLIVELEKSTNELKRTTTEIAWRGVAREVAHEIKNSLTPMKLSVQLLQRSIEKKDNNIEEKMQRTTNTIIEQIDALSNIADSFSRYAKLPENHPEPIELVQIIKNIINLYDNTENIEFGFHYNSESNYIFIGDKTNLNSALNNLIKNATQAIGSKQDGKIIIILESQENTYEIYVKDNGKGIKEEDKEKIFVPNFTTKTGGSGIGLSLTYNIIQSMQGNITFESEEGIGTQFKIELPKKANKETKQ